MKKTRYFEAKKYDHTQYCLLSDLPEDSLVLVCQGPILPKGQSELLVLHGIHSNGGLPMIWNEENGTFKCQHCNKNFSMSEKLFMAILLNLNDGRFETVDLKTEPGKKVLFAHLVKEFSDDILTPNGFYVKELEL